MMNAATNNSRPRVVLLDVDGTLLDSNNAHALSWVEALESYGRPVPFSTIRPLIGMGGDRLLKKVVDIDEESTEGKAISEARKRIFRTKYLPDLQPFEGVRGLLQTMKDQGLRLYVATSSGEDMVNDLLDRAQVRDLIEKKTTKDDAESSKPSPDIIEAALKIAKATPDESIMIGDTPYDVEAAARAGVRTIAFECGGWSILDLGQAAAVYKDASDLLQHFDKSLLSNKGATGETGATATTAAAADSAPQI